MPYRARPFMPDVRWRVASAHRDRLVREALRRALAQGPFDLAWHAHDAAELEQFSAEAPAQLVIAELELLGPHAEAVAALRRRGSLVVALARRDAVGAAYEAMGRGVLGLAEPPVIAEDGELLGAPRFLEKIERLARLVQAEAPLEAKPALQDGVTAPIVALGASTGGPLALATVLGSLPADFPAAIVVVQHIENEYSQGLATWLSSYCALPVEIAVSGGMPRGGCVHLAGPGGHLLLASRRFSIQPAPPTDLHVPSIDVLFNSLAQHGAPGVAAILTGMGADGVAGLGALRARGWHTLAQDESSSVVYGMPRAAAETGAAERTLPLAEIGPALIRYLSRRGRT